MQSIEADRGALPPMAWAAEPAKPGAGSRTFSAPDKADPSGISVRPDTPSLILSIRDSSVQFQRTESTDATFPEIKPDDSGQGLRDAVDEAVSAIGWLLKALNLKSDMVERAEEVEEVIHCHPDRSM